MRNWPYDCIVTAEFGTGGCDDGFVYCNHGLSCVAGQYVLVD